MGIGIVFSHIVTVLVDRGMGRQFFQPDVIVVMEAGFIVIDEYGGGDVHRVAEHQAFGYAAFVDAFLNIGCDIDESPAGRYVEPQLFSVTFQNSLLISP